MAAVYQSPSGVRIISTWPLGKFSGGGGGDLCLFVT